MSAKLVIKNLLPVLLVALLVAAPVVSFAQDQEAGRSADECGTLIFDPLCNLTKFFNYISIQIGYGIAYLAAFLVSIAGSIIQILINLGSKVISNPLVTTGFKITLDVANLGFVLAIIVLAYATMFRVSGYEMKAFLRNLVLAALLVNFSFIIAGTIIDATNVFGNFFINAASPDGIAKFGDNLANSLNVQKLLNVVPRPGDLSGGSFLKTGISYFGMFASIAVTAIFSVFMVITFFAIALMLFIRYIYITFLLILMPLAWLAWVFPGYSKHFKAWWDKFLQWNIFYPAVALFLYLGIQSSQEIGKLVQLGAKGGGAIEAATKMSALGEDTIIIFIQIFVQIGLMLGGLVVANSMKMAGAEIAMGWAGSARKWITGAAGRATGLPAAYRGARGTAAGVGVATGGAAAGVAAKALSSKALSWIPGARGAAAGLYNAAASRKTYVTSLQKEEFEKDSDDAILVKAQQLNIDKPRKAALANEIVKRGLVDKVDRNRLENEYLPAAKELGVTKEILEKRPDFAAKLTNLEEMKKKDPTATELNWERKAVQSAMARFKPSEVDKLDQVAIERIGEFFGQAHRERLAKEGSDAQLLAFLKATEKIRGEQISAGATVSHPNVDFMLNNPALRRITLNPEFSKDLANLRKSVETRATEEATEAKEKKIKESVGKRQPGKQ